MAYNQNIPLARDEYPMSQGDMLQNFQAIDTVTQLNHVIFNDADQGKHKFVQFPNQSSEPTTGGTQVALYGALGQSRPPVKNPVSGLIFKRSDGTLINFTDQDTLNQKIGLLPNQLRDYWNRLPSGLLVKVASLLFNVNPTNNATPTIDSITTATFGPAFNNVYWATITPQRDPNIDPNASNADPNVVIYVTSFNVNLINFIAWTRNLFSNGRQDPKRNVFLRIVVIGD